MGGAEPNTQNAAEIEKKQDRDSIVGEKVPISRLDLGPQENNRRKLEPFGGVLIGCQQRL